MPASELAKSKAAKAKEQEAFKQSVEDEASLRKSRAPSGIVESKPIFTRPRVGEPVIHPLNKSKKVVLDIYSAGNGNAGCQRPKRNDIENARDCSAAISCTET